MTVALAPNPWPWGRAQVGTVGTDQRTHASEAQIPTQVGPVHPDNARTREAAPLELRPYQRDALEAIRSAEQRGITRQLLALPTGTGKTVVFAHQAARFPGRVLVLAHREELLAQAADKLRMVDPSIDVGIVRASENNTTARVVVASIATLARESRLARLACDFGLVIVDEAHHAAADTYQRVLEWSGAFEPNGPLVLGFTATPERGDGASLGQTFQETVYAMALVSAIAQGYLSDLRAVQVRIDSDFGSVRTRGGDFVDSDLADELLVVDAPRTVARSYVEHARDRKGILFAPTVATAEAFANALRDVGVRAEWLSGETPRDERRAILNRLHRGATQVVSNVGVLTEGFDEPSVNCVIVARPTKSRPLYQQMVGRGTRKYPGKDDCLILDLAGMATRHSLVSTASLFDLDGGALRSGQTVTEALQEKAKRDHEQAQDDPFAAISEVRQQVVAEAVSLFRQRPMHWVQSGHTFVLPIQGGRIVLQPMGAHWRVMELVNGKSPRQLGDRLPLEFAQGVGEDRVRQLGALHLVAPNAPWRSDPASPKQIERLRTWGLWRAGLSKGEASDLISARFSGRPV